MNDAIPQLEIEVNNPAEFLHDESGTFEVISPYGQAFCVTCRPGSRMNIRQISEAKNVSKRERMTWTIRRVNNAAQWPISPFIR